MGSILKLEDLVSKNMSVVSPNLSFFYKEEKVIEILKAGEEIAEFLLQERHLLEKDYIRDIENQKKLALLEADTIKKQAYDEGMAAGKEEVLKKFSYMFSFFDESKKNLEETLNQIMETSEKQILEFAFAVTEKLISNELKYNKELFVHTVKELLKNVSERKRITIQANPEDYELLEQYQDLLRKQTGMVRQFSVEKNAAVSRGGVVFDMESGILDAQVETQIDRIREAFHAGL